MAGELNKCDDTNEADEANDATICQNQWADEAEVADLLLPFPLTKFPAFFSKDKKVYFGIRVNIRNNNVGKEKPTWAW